MTALKGWLMVLYMSIGFWVLGVLVTIFFSCWEKRNKAEKFIVPWHEQKMYDSTPNNRKHVEQHNPDFDINEQTASNAFYSVLFHHYNGGKYLLFLSSCSVKWWNSQFSQFVYFLKKVCAFFNFWMIKCTENKTWLWISSFKT